jgi:hypothetical protein
MVQTYIALLTFLNSRGFSWISANQFAIRVHTSQQANCRQQGSQTTEATKATLGSVLEI